MRNFAKIAPTFWTGQTGRQINSLPVKIRDTARILAAYLFSSPYSSAAGLYQIPLVIAGHHTGKTPDEIRAAMHQLQEMDFAQYDDPTEFVWVKEMAEFQIGLPLKYEDDRRLWVSRWWLNLEENPFIIPFYERYKIDLHLMKRAGGVKGGSTVRRRGVGGDKTLDSNSNSNSNSKTGTQTQTQTQTPGKGDRGETQDRELAEVWAKIVKAAESIFSNDHIRHIRSNRLVRIDSKGIYVLSCPSSAHAEMMKENAALLRSAARNAGVLVSRWCFVQTKRKEEVIVR